MLALALLGTLGFGLHSASQAQACSCYYPPEFTYADHVEAAQDVVVGQVIFSFHYAEHIYTAFKPELDAKGCLASQGKTLWIETASEESLCGVTLQPGERRVLHLNGKGESGTYPLGLCTFHKNIDDLSPEEMNHLINQSPECNNDRSSVPF